MHLCKFWDFLSFPLAHVSLSKRVFDLLVEPCVNVTVVSVGAMTFGHRQTAYTRVVRVGSTHNYHKKRECQSQERTWARHVYLHQIFQAI